MRRLDEYELSQHYRFWKTDFDLLADLGVRAVRWGIPWYRVQPKLNEWDWSWTDQALDYLVNVKGITPILDLMHYGTPLWLQNSFLNAHYPSLVARYTQAVANRYKSLVHYYTPLNEPTVTAEWCGKRGVWPPYLHGDDGYVKVILAVAKGLVLAVQALKAEQPDMETVQVEAMWRFSTEKESLQAYIHQYNELQYCIFDLTTGRVDQDHPLYTYLRHNGVTRYDLSWLHRNAVTYDYLGINFYPWSYGRVSVRGGGLMYRLSHGINGLAIAEVISAAYERYHIPMLVTETSARREQVGRGLWMDETIAAVRGLRQRGIPIIGYTWFPFFSMFSWFYRTGRLPIEHYLLHLGLYECHFDQQGNFIRQPTALLDRYRYLMSETMPEVEAIEAPKFSGRGGV